MGNYKFRLSDMIPNAWFYKLKDMSRLNKNHHHSHHHGHKTSNPTTKKLHTPSSSSPSSLSSSSSSLAPPPNNHPSEITKLPHLSDQRKSYYITRDLTLHPNPPITTRTPVSDTHDFRTETPRRSSRRRRSTKRNRIQHRQPAEQRLVSSSISSGCSFRATLESVWTKPPPEDCADSHTDRTSSSDERGSTLTENGSDRGLIPDDAFDYMRSSSNSCKCTTGNNVVNIDVEDSKSISDFDHHDLPPIITRKHHHEEPTKIQQRASHGSLSVKAVKAESFSSPVRRFSGNSSLSPGVKLRTNTPKIGNRRVQGRKSVSSTGGSRRSVSESFAVVKSSKDPGRDFKESMVEMILENNIRSSKDLEELLACYLSLNSDEYHELIIDVFKQIWFDFIRFRRK